MERGRRLRRLGDGERQTRLWRRSYHVAPPPPTAEAWQLQLEIPTGIPLPYELGPDLRPDDLGGQYLDPRAAPGTKVPFR